MAWSIVRQRARPRPQQSPALFHRRRRVFRELDYLALGDSADEIQVQSAACVPPPLDPRRDARTHTRSTESPQDIRRPAQAAISNRRAVLSTLYPYADSRFGTDVGQEGTPCGNDSQEYARPACSPRPLILQKGARFCEVMRAEDAPDCATRQHPRRRLPRCLLRPAGPLPRACRWRSDRREQRHHPRNPPHQKATG